MASSWLIDDKGKTISSNQIDFVRATGVPESSEMRTYSILNVGFVGVTERQKQVHIQYRPKSITECALATLLYYLNDNAFRPVTVTWFGEVWNIERAPNGKVAAEFVKHSLDSIYPTIGRDRIKTAPSKTALLHWINKQEGIFERLQEPKLLADYLDLAFWGRWMLIDVAACSRAVAIVRRGAGYPMYDPVLSGSSRQQIDDLQDPHYRGWALRSIRTVAETGEPTFDDVDAYIAWPRFGDMRTRYWRLIVPLGRSEGSTRLLAASGSDSGIDLRPQTVEELRDILGSVGHRHPAQDRF